MKHIVLSTLFTQKKNPVHARTDVSADLPAYVKEWHESMTANSVNCLIFHDGLPEEFIHSHTNALIGFKRVPTSIYNACDGRWPIYRDFLETLEDDDTYVFATDISDVVMGKNPFTGQLEKYGKNILFSGDEPTTYKNSWIQKRTEDLKDALPIVHQHIFSNPGFRLLNCGVIGGSLTIMKEYVKRMSEMIEEAGPIEKTVDMPVHNYIARTYFGDRVKHGAPVNSVFRKLEKNRKDVWFIHK